MNLHVWWDEPADGPTNMAADELLAKEAMERDAMCVRMYGWLPATVSLGGFQRSADARAEAALAGVSLVRRPSGGGAIVHGSDLTYAAAVPRHHPWGGRPQLLYDAVHESLRQALAEFGVIVELWRPSGPAPAAKGEPFFCFDRRSPGDVVMVGADAPAERGHKVMGSAQRRLAATVLQHGSLLLGRNRWVGLNASHPGLEELAPGRVPAAAIPRLVETWLALTAAGLAGSVVREPGRFATAQSVREAARAFADRRWTDRR